MVQNKLKYIKISAKNILKIDEVSIAIISFPEHASSNFLTEADDFDPCNRYSPLFDFEDSQPLSPGQGFCEAAFFNSSSKMGCDGRFVYDRSQMTRTVATDLNLVCDNDYKRLLFGTILMVGECIGNIGRTYSRREH